MPATRKWLLLLGACLVIVLAFHGCRGFKRPMQPTPVPGAAVPGAAPGEAAGGKGWALIPLNIASTAEGDLHVDMAVRNDTGQWSVMTAEDKPATLITNSGKSIPCDTVQVSSGGHYRPARLPVPGHHEEG